MKIKGILVKEPSFDGMNVKFTFLESGENLKEIIVKVTSSKVYNFVRKMNKKDTFKLKTRLIDSNIELIEISFQWKIKN